MKFALQLTAFAALTGLIASDSGESERKVQETCYEPEFTFLALINLAAPWPPQCTGCDNIGEPKCMDNPCWCLPPRGSDHTDFCCPDPEGRPMVYEFQVADAFRRNRLSETLGDPIALKPPGCATWEIMADSLPQHGTMCDELPGYGNPDAVCGFIYNDNDPDCGGLDSREYGMRTYENMAALEAAGAVLTHLGHCGICSNQWDLAAMIDPRLSFTGFRGICANVSLAALDTERLEANETMTIYDTASYACMKESLGVTDDCAYMLSMADISASLTRNPGETEGVCNDFCRELLSTPPDEIHPTLPNCNLHPCLQCELDFRTSEGGEPADLYHRFAGRSQENSGIVAYSQVYRSNLNTCEDMLANPIILQDPYANAPKSVPEQDIPVSESNDASGFDPSYSLLLQTDTCFYVLEFHMKMDETLPHAGGWDTTLPNGVDRDTFNAHCTRDEDVMADDGIPYRRRRKFYFEFGQDVKDVTGIFDHVSIDFNPCGHHDEIFFGRAHVDVHFYTINDEWRTIMECDTTQCDPADCKFDQSFQSTESGKAFFNIEQCFQEPWFADQLPPGFIEENPGFFKGAFNKNMPVGFRSLSHTGNPHSGLHAINIGTALQWLELETPFVETWSEPVQFMMSFDNLVTVWESMVPVEFFQGPEARQFSTPESPPNCQTNMGVPITYSARYNNETGYTTFQLVGTSPYCACGNPGTEYQGFPGACEANDAEQAAYVETCKKFAPEGATFCDNPRPAPVYDSPFGKFMVSEVEAAFGLDAGSLITKDNTKYDTLKKNNFWTDWVGKPVILTDFTTVVPTVRNQFFQTAVGLGAPTFLYREEVYFEQPLLGCFYEPKTPEIEEALDANGLSLCNNEPGGFAEVILPYHVVGYVNEKTRLLYFGTDAEYADDAQFMSQFVLSRIVDEPDPPLNMDRGDIFQYELLGPSVGDVYDGFKDHPTVTAVNAAPFPLGNHGHFRATLMYPDLTAPCPDDFCGSFIEDLIPNPLAPDAPWPEKIGRNECVWFFCENLPQCADFVHPFPEWKNECKTSEPSSMAPSMAPSMEPTPMPSSATSLGIHAVMLLASGFSLFMSGTLW